MIFNIKDYGAKGDGETLNTSALQDAIDACDEAGGGVVLCEPGVYVTGSFELKSNVELHLSAGCKILASADINDFKHIDIYGLDHCNEGLGASYLVSARDADNIAITGSGEMDAAGLNCYKGIKLRDDGKMFAQKPVRRYRLALFYKCTNIRITDASFIDAPCYNLWLIMCKGVNISRIKIRTDFKMHNGDGINIDGCRNVTVSDSYVKSSDDSIVIRAIQKAGEEECICENVTVSNCTLESACQGIRISCPSDHITRDCTFTNLIIKSQSQGINMDHRPQYINEGGSDCRADISNMLFSNILIECNAVPIAMVIQEGVEIKQLKGISFSNIRINSILPITVKGNDKVYVEDISFNNIILNSIGAPYFPGAEEAVTFKNCKGVKLNNVEITNLNGIKVREFIDRSKGK